MTTPTVVRLLSTADAAAYCDVDQRTMRRWIAQGLLPGARKIGRLWYVDEPHLSMFIGDVPRPSMTHT